MALQLVNLDSETRRFMLEELDWDLKQDNLYISENLSPNGTKLYVDLLRNAMTSGTDDTLIAELHKPGIFNATERPRPHGKSGKIISPKMRVTAPEMLGEGEFNRYYARGLARRASEAHMPHLVIYRAKQVSNPRPESEARIGATVEPNALVADLRDHAGRATFLGVPGGANSGISVRLP
jgi:hypothetical protein